MSADAELIVTRGSPTPEEICAVLVALRAARAVAGTEPATAGPAPRGDPWPVPRAAPAVSPVSWAG